MHFNTCKITFQPPFPNNVSILISICHLLLPFLALLFNLSTFKMKLMHFLVGNRNTYPDFESQLLYAGQLLEGPAYQWYHAIVDPKTTQFFVSYDLARFFQELEDFFGGAVTLHSRERSLDMLRQTG